MPRAPDAGGEEPANQPIRWAAKFLQATQHDTCSRGK